MTMRYSAYCYSTKLVEFSATTTSPDRLREIAWDEVIRQYGHGARLWSITAVEPVRDRAEHPEQPADGKPLDAPTLITWLTRRIAEGVTPEGRAAYSETLTYLRTLMEG